MARVACAQLSPSIADPQANREIAEHAIREAIGAKAQIIILPELATTGYHLSPAEAVALSEEPNGASIASWVSTLAGSDAIVVGGFCERGSDGRIYNSAAMVSSDGVMAVYRKTHLWGQEHRLFSAGTELPKATETPWGPVGMAICYDLFFPELTRGLALQGALLLAVPTNSPSGESRAQGAMAACDGIGHAVARTTAYLNRVYVAVSDRHGDERGHSWTARSSIVDPEGLFLAGPVGYERSMLVADCDLTIANQKQWDGTENNAFADRRPELYSSVSALSPTAAPATG